MRIRFQPNDWYSYSSSESSSTTTSSTIIVGLVGSDNGIVSVQQGIYMVMGANIGTTLTIVRWGAFRLGNFGRGLLAPLSTICSISCL
jgi:hypothetical protein